MAASSSRSRPLFTGCPPRLSVAWTSSNYFGTRQFSNSQRAYEPKQEQQRTQQTKEQQADTNEETVSQKQDVNKESAEAANQQQENQDEGDKYPASETGAPEGAQAGEQDADPRDKQIAELKDSYLRALAEMENLRERTRREVEHTAQFAIQKFAKDLVGTVDVLSLALQSVPDDARKNAERENPHLHNLYTGVSMTEAELLKTLKRHGVEQIYPMDERFDPNLHEALYQAAIPGKEVGVIFNVQKVGYKLNGRMIRPPQVGVVKDADTDNFNSSGQ